MKNILTESPAAVSKLPHPNIPSANIGRLLGFYIGI